MAGEIFGPWVKDIGEAERLARLRSLRTVLECSHGADHPLNQALYFAETGEPADMQAAMIELDRVPARDRRKMLSIYCRVNSYKPTRKGT